MREILISKNGQNKKQIFILHPKRAQMDTSFGWIFAIIVGAIILFLAIFGVAKFMNIQKTQQSAETGKEIGVILNPLETGFESGQKVLITFPTETRLLFKCDTQGIFGRQRVQVLQKTFDKWTESGINIYIKNKYIFSADLVEGKKFYAFSKPYEFPTENRYDSSFKIADLIYITSINDKYCFSGASSSIENELKNLNIGNIFVENCSSGDIKVCFDSVGSDCDILVNYESGTVKKNSSTLYFEDDALMYAAVFSSSQNYECQIQRLIKRSNQIVSLYEEKSRIEKIQGCSGEMEAPLIIFGNLLREYSNSKNLGIINEQAKKLNKLNGNEGDCRLW